MDPYRFISRRSLFNKSKVFFSRLMFRPTVYMTGEEAAQLFYDETYFQRAGAAPSWLQKTLFGEGGIQVVDDGEHKRRKQMFMNMFSVERVERLTQIVSEVLEARRREWKKRPEVNLYFEFQEALTDASCQWAGIPLDPSNLDERASQLTLLFDGAGSVGVGHLEARRARSNLERWLGSLIEQTRQDNTRSNQDDALSIISFYRDYQDKLLDTRTASVELLNVIRPTVAVSVYAVHSALALYLYPDMKNRLRSESDFLELFVHEIRRFFPFFPSVMAKVRRDFEWNGFHFKQGWLAVLDLHGINHDPEIWDSPFAFEPDRFRTQRVGLYNFIPQGGGETLSSHRCAGEVITVQVMKTIIRFLVDQISYQVPKQDLEIDWRRLPAIPRSGFTIVDIQDVVLNDHDGDRSPSFSVNQGQCPYTHHQ